MRTTIHKTRAAHDRTHLRYPILLFFVFSHFRNKSNFAFCSSLAFSFCCSIAICLALASASALAFSSAIGSYVPTFNPAACACCFVSSDAIVALEIWVSIVASFRKALDFASLALVDK